MVRLGGNNALQHNKSFDRSGGSVSVKMFLVSWLEWFRAARSIPALGAMNLEGHRRENKQTLASVFNILRSITNHPTET